MSIRVNRPRAHEGGGPWDADVATFQFRQSIELTRSDSVGAGADDRRTTVVTRTQGPYTLEIAIEAVDVGLSHQDLPRTLPVRST